MTETTNGYNNCLLLLSIHTVNPVLLAAATNTVVCSRNEDENAKVGVRL